MSPSFADFVPPADPAPESPTPVDVPRPRGGPRPGAGAPRGNLNALKHGRYSRFRDMLAPQPVTAAAARRLITREQRAAERHAANLMTLARVARHGAECAAAIAEGRPLPPPPLSTLRDVDLKSLKRLLADFGLHMQLERLHAAGRLDPESKGVAEQRAFAEEVFTAIPLAVAALDRAAAASSPPPSSPPSSPSPSPRTTPTSIPVQSPRPNSRPRLNQPHRIRAAGEEKGQSQ